MTTTPTPPTDDELAAMRARADAVTPGQFVVGHSHGGEWKVIGPQGAIARDMSEDDAVLLANARTDIDTLLAEVERLRKMVADLQDEKQDLEDEVMFSVMERMSEDD